MKYIRKITHGVNVAPMMWSLRRNPHLWDEQPLRTQSPDSPFYETNDIWARFAAPGVDFSQPHDSIWRSPSDVLPVKELVYPLMNMIKGDRLGGVLITKIPAGKAVKPHTDPGWHARFYDKYAIQIDSAPGQEFCFEGESLVTLPGDVFWFDNSYPHWVTNPTQYDRITAIVCIRKEN